MIPELQRCGQQIWLHHAQPAQGLTKMFRSAVRLHKRNIHRQFLRNFQIEDRIFGLWSSGKPDRYIIDVFGAVCDFNPVWRSKKRCKLSAVAGHFNDPDILADFDECRFMGESCAGSFNLITSSASTVFCASSMKFCGICGKSGGMSPAFAMAKSDSPGRSRKCLHHAYLT